MKNILSLLTVLLVLALIQPSISFSQEIEIKGLRLGMTMAEVESKVGKLPLKNFTIAGVKGKYEDSNPVIIKFYEGKLDVFVFFFDANHFDDVLEAVKTKYPSLECAKSNVSNAMGASFDQVKCNLHDQSGSLSLSRFVSDIKTSALSLMSDRAIKETKDKQKEKRKDL